jgi:hypothetical protein
MDIFKQQLQKDMAPHMARALRDIQGYPEGTQECERCGALTACRRRQRTLYEDEESNWATLCPACQKEADAYWDERWAEYYGMIL